jgi:hypothetical protein
MRYIWMSQQTCRAWHSSWYMSVMFMGAKLRKTSSSANQDNRRRYFESTRQLCDIKWTWYLYWWHKSHDRETVVEAVAPDATWVQCSIHREVLVAKGMPDSLKDVLDTTVKVVNFVKARPLYSCVFSALCNDMGSDYVTLLQHMCAGYQGARYWHLFLGVRN